MALCKDLLDDLAQVDVLLATELRADAEENLAEDNREMDASKGKNRARSDATACRSSEARGDARDLLGPAREAGHSQDELSQAVIQIIQAEVNRAIDQQAAQIRADIVQASDSMWRSLDQLLSAIQGELHYWEQVSQRKKPVASGLEALPEELCEESDELVQSVAEQLEQQAGEARKNMDAQIAEQLQEVFESCQVLEEECWSDAGWHEVEATNVAREVPASSRRQKTPWPDKDMAAVLACPRNCSRACERNSMVAERLQELLASTVATVELESRARQESELCLSGQLTDLRTKVAGSMCRLLKHLEKHNSAAKFSLGGRREPICYIDEQEQSAGNRGEGEGSLASMTLRVASAAERMANKVLDRVASTECS